MGCSSSAAPLSQGGKIIRFRAEGKIGDASQAVQDAHAAQGEMLRFPHGPGNRQLQHHVRAMLQRHPRPKGRGEQRTLPTLGEAAGHYAYHPVSLGFLPCLAQVIGMPQVKGIVFRNDADRAHRLTPPPLR